MLKGSPFVLLVLVLAFAMQAKDKGPISAAVKNATYVYVMAYSGDLTSPDVTPEDRHAVADVQKSIEKWGRYKLVYNRGEADLILVVRTGRAVEARGTAEKGTGNTGPVKTRSSAESIGGELGDPQDTLDVYLASQGIGGVPLWRGRAADGLKAPEMALVQEFRSKVEAADKKKP